MPYRLYKGRGVFVLIEAINVAYGLQCYKKYHSTYTYISSFEHVDICKWEYKQLNSRMMGNGGEEAKEVEEDTYDEYNNSDCSSYNSDISIRNDHTINSAIDVVNEWTSSSDDDDNDGNNDGDCNNNDAIKRYVRQHEGICLEYRKTQFE